MDFTEVCAGDDNVLGIEYGTKRVSCHQLVTGRCKAEYVSRNVLIVENLIATSRFALNLNVDGEGLVGMLLLEFFTKVPWSGRCRLIGEPYQQLDIIFAV